jgi:DNA-binding MarR family transcriptional regulator
MARTGGGGRRVPDVDYETLAELRYQIRRFLRVREMAARAAGIEPQHYLVLLQVKGLEGKGPATIGALAERLQLHHHSTVELVDRLVEQGMVVRERTREDRREVVVRLRPRGEAVLRKLVSYSVAELRTEGPSLVTALTRLISGSRSRRTRPRGSRTVRDRGPGATSREASPTKSSPRVRAGTRLSRK